ncbi:MAG: glycosyltransferase [Lachnospiraceae bacterium]|nr:glycosyltransferase [Lachnospiraceae bacterium]MBD5497033.1 glycosyltransferase [Lachnospiraceae bacterium]MBD5510990.1 glycosyltransferase [Lachnospiraceae bacterium]
MKEVLVSVWCLTYNQERYIREALDSFLAQETNFDYEIVVHDDASADRTPEILKEYEEKYPDVVHGIYQAENQTVKNGADRSWVWRLQAAHCRGKYIAFCEGDDYWLDAHKLQMQVNYMENNPECVLTVHDAVKVNVEKGEAKAMHPYADDCDISADEIIMQYHGILPTASMVFRKSALNEDFYQYFLGAGLGDYPLQLFMVSHGKVHYFSRIMSAYRYMHADSWSKRVIADSKRFVVHTLQMIWLLKTFDGYTGGKYGDSTAKRIKRFETSIFPLYCKYASLEFFEKACEQYDIETNRRYHDEFEREKELFTQIFAVKADDLLGDIRRLCQEYRHIYIMGAGAFGAAIAEQMKYSGIDFEGFVISGNVEEGKTYMEKPVWGLKDIPHALDEVGIVVGINLEKWPDAIESLKAAGIKNYLVSAMLKGFMEIESGC